MPSFKFRHLEVEVQEEADGTWGVYFFDEVTFNLWLEAVCETKTDAMQTAMSLLETEAIKYLIIQDAVSKINERGGPDVN